MASLTTRNLSAVDTPEDPLVPARSHGLMRMLRRTRESGSGTLVGLGIVAVFAVWAMFAPVIAPHDPNYQYFEGLTDLGEPLRPGDATFLLGTDTLGRDLLSRLIYGARVAMFVAIVPNGLALLLATAVGATAGFYRGWIETVLMRITETMMVLPTFLLALALLTVLGPGLGVVVTALVLVSWTYPARVVYGETLRVRELNFVEAARASGASGPRIILWHVLPQLRGLLLLYFTLNAASMVLLEAGLGFLGFGVQPPTPSWGLMIAGGRNVLFWPWLMLLPGGCLALLGTGFYLVGHAVQQSQGARLGRVRL